MSRYQNKAPPHINIQAPPTINTMTPKNTVSMAQKIHDARKDVNRKLIDEALERELQDLGINLDSELD